MYKVVLIDDDVLVTEFMETMIPWEQYGFHIIKTFKDSLLAYEYLKENPCDALITDIGMPKMNGIELITKLKKKEKLSYTVILSCHDDFNYVQQALQLEVFDYILKESMEEEEIIVLLRKLKGTMDRDLQLKYDHVKKEAFLQQNRMALKTMFIEKIMEEPYITDDAWWEQQEELLNIDVSRKNYMMAVCFIDWYEDAIKRYEKEILLQFSINNIIEEVLQKNTHDVQVFFLQGKFLILSPVDYKNWDRFEQSLRELKRSIHQFLKISITIIKKEESKTRENLVASIKLLLSHEEIRFYQPHGTIKDWQAMIYSKSTVFENYLDIMHELRYMIMNKEIDKTQKLIQVYLSTMKTACYLPSNVKGWAIKLVLDIKLYVNTQIICGNKQSLEMTDQVTQNIKTFEQLEQILINALLDMIHHVEKNEKTTENKYIQQAKMYIRSRIHEKISLGDMAAYLHLNASYFSRMFKQETGESFIEFVTKIKMEEAKELLDHTNRSIEEISEDLGFASKNYFVKTFHKQFGVTPKVYKDKESV